MMKRRSLFILAFAFLAGCPSKKTTPGNASDDSDPGNPQWIRLAEVLDAYDEAAKITSEFQLDVFVDGAVVDSSSGRHEYTRGEEKWFYLKNGELEKTVECHVDKAVVRVPLDKQPKPKKGKKKVKSDDPDADIVSIYQSKYPCALQALVRYNSELKGNKLTHDGKVYVVNSFDADKKTISKISMHKDNRIIVYSFTGFKLEQFQPEEPAAPAPEPEEAQPEEPQPGAEAPK